jgi:glycosyltransferase involved in cell wall biosynthesis
MLSVIVITCNEEKNIVRCLKSVKFADEIIVVDSGSRDNTVALARSYGARVIETDWPGYGVQKQRSLDLATHEWVLSLDADEFLAEDAHTQILKAIQTQTIDAFQLPRQMVFYGKVLKYAAYEKKHIRLFRREKAHFSLEPVHEKVVMAEGSQCKRLPIIIFHDCYRDLTDAVTKMNRYSSLSAGMRLQHSKTASFWKAWCSSKWMFIKSYILQGWFLDGVPGYALSLYQSQGSWYRYMKQLFPDQEQQ